MANLDIGDWHYDHKNILAIDNRPFKTIEEMNEALISRWNAVVSRQDTVYVLGDMFWCNEKIAAEVLRTLKGTKILIRGNHDACKKEEFRSQFAAIEPYMEVKDGDKNVVLCHYPIPCFKNHFYGWWHLYAHVHVSFEANMMEHDRFLMEELYGHPCNMINAGAMMPWMDYTPRMLEQIETGYKEWKARGSEEG